MRQQDDSYLMSIEVNGVIKEAVTNDDPREYKNVKLYLSNPWQPVAPVALRSLKIKTGFYYMKFFVSCRLYTLNTT